MVGNIQKITLPPNYDFFNLMKNIFVEIPSDLS